jgi:hypothetical protein
VTARCYADAYDAAIRWVQHTGIVTFREAARLMETWAAYCEMAANEGRVIPTKAYQSISRTRLFQYRSINAV